MTKERQRQRVRRGSIVQIDLGTGELGFAQVLEPPLMAFFDLKATECMAPDEIIKAPIAFSVWVMKYAVSGGDWPVIGRAEVAEDLNERPAFYKRDRISGALYITYTGAEEVPATLDDVEGLECAAVWEPEHVVDRLNDYFAGRPNKWVESMRP